MTRINSFSAELEEPNEIGRFTSWDLDFRQISGGSGRTKVAIRAGQALSTLWIGMPCRVHQVGAAPGDLLTFGLPKPRGLSKWLQSETPDLPLVCFGTGHEFDGVSEAGFEALTISVNRGTAEAMADAFGLDVPTSATSPSVINLAAKSRAAELIWRKSVAFSDCEADAVGPEREEDLLLALLLAVSKASVHIDRSSPRMRDRVLRRALDLIDAEADDPPSIGDLCILCDTSWPTLHRAFVERFGVSPKAYLMALRLNRTRQDLLSGNSRLVQDAANRWGFWHMGQFARDYQELFKRLPSEDLNRAR